MLQKGSPQVDERGSNYVAGAHAGDFWFKNAEQEIVAGDLGFNFWPLGYHKNFVEWRPNRGGIVTAHLDPPPEAKWRVEANKENNRERKILELPNGNYLEETAYHYGVVNSSVWVLTFRSTGLADSRAFNTAMGALTFEDHPLDGYGAVWRITSKLRTSGEYNWYAVKFALLFRYGQRDDEGKLLMPTSMLLRGREKLTPSRRRFKPGRQHSSARNRRRRPRSRTGPAATKSRFRFESDVVVRISARRRRVVLRFTRNH